MLPTIRLKLVPGLLLAGLLTVAAFAQQAAAPATETVRAINAPKTPFPSESASAGVTKFSFIVYGDTRGRRDGRELQYEHSLLVNSMLGQILKLKQTAYPVRFVLQSGDAVANGREVQQLNVSFVDLINKLTGEGDVPYFLAPGNHDVTSALVHDDPERQKGVRNFLAMNANLIPADGNPRRLDGYPVFAVGYGNSFFIAFDSQIAGDEKQFAWVKAQLEGLDRNRYKNVFVFCHHPAFSSGPHGGAHVEKPTAIIRERYMPLFRKHRVRGMFAGHEHFFEHWVERYEDAAGKKYRFDQVITGGGGAPLYAYAGDPDVREYRKMFASEKVVLDRIAKPAGEPGGNAYHYVLVTVDGERIKMEVVGVDWGRDFQPYRSNKANLNDEEVK
jgi:hypothetical protein